MTPRKFSVYEVTYIITTPETRSRRDQGHAQWNHDAMLSMVCRRFGHPEGLYNTVIVTVPEGQDVETVFRSTRAAVPFYCRVEIESCKQIFYKKTSTKGEVK